MTNHINNINNYSTVIQTLQAVDVEKIEQHLNQRPNARLLVLNLDDLNADILNQLKAMQFKMVLLHENFKIVEDIQSTQLKAIQLNMDGCRQLVAIENIVRLEACGNYTYVHLKNYTKPVLTSKTLKFYVKQLCEKTFVRPHQSYLVNRHFIEKVVLKPKAVLILKDGSQIAISRRKLREFRQWKRVGL